MEEREGNEIDGQSNRQKRTKGRNLAKKKYI
jgi:hypothetical protein